jgi:ATP-binding cassette, subfamily G (WHITE), member 2, SNQ2
MVNEFADQSYLCSSSDLAPSGTNFADMSHQVCAVAGSIPGRDTVRGSTYIEANYGLGVGNLWRNVGINIAIMIFFTVWTGVAMELHRPPAGKAATVHYRTLSSSSSTKTVTGSDTSDADIEKGVTEQSVTNVRGGLGPSGNRDSLIESHQGRTLSWRNLSLDIDVGGESKRLLQDLNGTQYNALYAKLQQKVLIVH